jgi:hypothetical protein
MFVITCNGGVCVSSLKYRTYSGQKKTLTAELAWLKYQWPLVWLYGNIRFRRYSQFCYIETVNVDQCVNGSSFIQRSKRETKTGENETSEQQKREQKNETKDERTNEK